MRALVVEDSKTQAIAVAHALREAGFEVTIAHDGEAGLEAARSALPDVVVSDVLMPRMDGFELCKRLKDDASTRRVPVVLMTSVSQPVDVVRALASGADGFVSKPFDGRALGEQLSRLAARGVRQPDDDTVEVDGHTLRVGVGKGQMLDVLVAALESAKTRYEEAERQHTVAERAVRDRDELIAIVSHDLRNPLSVLISAIALAEQRPDDAADVAKKLGQMKRAAERMLRLVGDLLDVTTLEAGKMMLVHEDVDPAALVREALAAQRALAETKSITLAAEIGGDLGQLHADRDRLAQVFSNLMSNAIKFTPNGGRVTVRASRDGRDVRFEVVDTGSGIAPENVAHVFDRFWHSSGGTRRTAQQSTGLGLAIVKGIVEAHGGRASAESQVGVGSTFTFTIPLRAPA
jgi:signal transduction histidine kinase